METKTDVREIIAAGREGAKIDHRIGTFERAGFESIPYAIVREGEEVVVIDELLAEQERLNAHPRRRKGASLHHEVESFVEHILRHRRPESVVWANAEAMSFIAVYDYHGETKAEPGWCEHRSTYSCPTSPEWNAWTSQEDVPMSNEVFANFIESRMEDLTDGKDMPAPVELLEMARNLQIHTKGTFLRQINPETGAYHLISKEEQTQESTKIPRAFSLALRVFEGGDQYRVEARIQFRIANGNPQFRYSLHRAAEIARDAFGDVRKVVAERTELPVFAGNPER